MSDDTQSDDTQLPEIFSEGFGKTVDLGNTLADTNDKADFWDIADGILAGAIQYWLYTRAPCADEECEMCLSIREALGRLAILQSMTKQFAESSEYLETPPSRSHMH